MQDLQSYGRELNMKTLMIAIIASSLCSSFAGATPVEDIQEFGRYIMNGAPAATIHTGPTESDATPENRSFQVELELGKLNPLSHDAQVPSVTGSFLSTRGGSSNMPLIRVGAEVFFTNRLCAQFSHVLLKQSTNVTATTNVVFQQQTFTTGQIFTLQDTLRLTRLALAYELIEHERIDVSLGAGIANVDHSVTASGAGKVTDLSKSIFLPNLFTKIEVRLTDTWFANADINGYFFSRDNAQRDLSLGTGVSLGRFKVRVGSRWIKSQINHSDLYSELSNQAYFASLRCGF